MQRFSVGSALISALFIMTLVAIAATAMGTRLQTDISRARLEFTSDNTFLASQAVFFWACGELANPKNKFAVAASQGQVLVFPKRFQSLYPNLTIEGGLYDLQARFNLNNLASNHASAMFERLLTLRLPSLSTDLKKNLLFAIIEWISFYDPEKGVPLNTAYYAKQKPPYSISHQPFRFLSEFRLIKGVDATIYNTLKNDLIVLPEKTPLNINTAPPFLLKLLGDHLKDSEVDELIQARGKKGLADFNKLIPLLKKLNIRQEDLTKDSQYFMAIAKVKGDQFTRATYFVFKRSMNQKDLVSLHLISNSISID